MPAWMLRSIGMICLQKETACRSRMTAIISTKFPLNWETIGEASSKKRVPEQFSHNLGITYSIKNGRYNLSLECKNFTDEKLYDNYSLQKAGRAFYGKVRVYFGQ